MLLVWLVFLLAACGGEGQILAPQVTETSPTDQAKNVPVNASIHATFSSPVDPVTVNEKTFILTRITGTVRYQNQTATFHPATSLERGKIYNAILTTGIKDLDGIPLPSNVIWSFETESGPDTTPPSIQATIPHDGEKGVSVSAPMIVIFSEPIDQATLNSRTFFINGVKGMISYNEIERMATLKPEQDLNYSTSYRVTVTRGVRDLSGNPLARDKTWSCETASQDDRTPWTFTTVDAPLVGNVSPIGRNIPTDPPPPITATFSRAMKKSSVHEKSFIVSGLAPKEVFYNEDTLTATCLPSIPLQPNTTYQVTLTTEVEDAEGNPLESPFSWSFQTAPQPDLPPEVALTDPADGTLHVSVNLPQASAQFKQPIDPSSLNSRTLTLQETHGNCCLPGTISYDPRQQRAIFTFSGPLSHNTSYTATLGEEIRSSSGAPMGSPYVWRFTTEPNPDTTPPSVQSTDPLDGASDVPTTDPGHTGWRNTILFRRFDRPLQLAL